MGFWWDPRGKIKELVETWEPKQCKTEKEFERSLASFLESQLKGKEVVKQYAVGRIRGDIVIDGKILVEIKTNLDSTGKLQRLLGQIELYKEDWKKSVLLVLCGAHDTNLIKKLKDAVGRRRDAAIVLDDFFIDLVVK